MKWFAQFKTLSTSGLIIDALGTDGYLQLDGRKNMWRMLPDIHKYMEDLRNVRRFVGFDIHKGDLKKSRVMKSCTYTYLKRRKLQNGRG